MDGQIDEVGFCHLQVIRVSAGDLLLERGECDFSTFPSD